MRALVILIIIVMLKSEWLISQTIDPFVFGQNAWLPTVGTLGAGSNTVNTGGMLDNHFSNGDIPGSKVRVVRYGGTEFNENGQLNSDIIHNVLQIKAAGMEPIVQIPVGIPGNTIFTVFTATTLVHLLNSGGLNSPTYVKYFSIGNEPELIGWSTSQIYNHMGMSYFMKLVDPTIKTLGPELAAYSDGNIGNPMYNFLVTSLTGTANILPFVDFFSFHYYAFGDEGKFDQYFCAPTRSNVVQFLKTNTPQVGNPSVSNNSLWSNITAFQTKTATVGKPLAITEANICYANEVGLWSYSGTLYR